MSKIGAYNLELQEQANELGFETTQQALDAGCVVEGDCGHPVLVEPLEAAHRAFEREKADVLEMAKAIQRFFHEYDGRASEYSGITAFADRIVKFVEEAHE